MEENLIGEVAEEQDFEDIKVGELINFYGVVKDNNNLDVANAVVMVFACFNSAVEKPLGYTITDKEGRYFLSIPKFSDNHNLSGFKVTASKPHIISKAFDYPTIYEKESHKELELETMQCYIKESVLEQEELAYDLIFNIPKESHVVELIDLDKVGEGEYYPLSLEGVMIEPDQSTFCNGKVIENVYKKNNLTTTTTLFCSYLACSALLLLAKK